jgi:putative membrane protein
MFFLLRIVLNAGVLLLISNIVEGIKLGGWWSAIVTVIVLGIVNALIRPLILILTLPVNVLTLGLFTFVINALMFWFASSIVKGFEVAGFWSAFWGALLFSIASWIISSVVSNRE